MFSLYAQYSFPVGAVVGSILGGVVAVALIIFSLLHSRRRSKRRAQVDADERTVSELNGMPFSPCPPELHYAPQLTTGHTPASLSHPPGVTSIIYRDVSPTIHSVTDISYPNP